MVRINWKLVQGFQPPKLNHHFQWVALKLTSCYYTWEPMSSREHVQTTLGHKDQVRGCLDYVANDAASVKRLKYVFFRYTITLQKTYMPFLTSRKVCDMYHSLDISASELISALGRAPLNPDSMIMFVGYFFHALSMGRYHDHIIVCLGEPAGTEQTCGCLSSQTFGPAFRAVAENHFPFTP